MRKFSWLSLWMLSAAITDAQPALRLKVHQTPVEGQQPATDVAQNTRTPGRTHWLVQFRENPGGSQIQSLSNRGATVLSYVPDHALSVSASDDIQLDDLDVQWMGRLQPAEKISPQLADARASGGETAAVVEFYSDVDPNDARAIATQAGLVIQENPDLLANHLLVRGDQSQVLALAGWDEVAYLFPASVDLLDGKPVRSCAGALTSLGPVGQSVAFVDDGWAGPGHGAADLKYSFVQVTEKLPADAAEAEIVRALNEWAKYVKLTFTSIGNATADRTIAILFANGAHGDGYPFDGPGGVVAHTFYPVPTTLEPLAGDMHFDDAESWRIGTDVDVFSIALHEAGHGLGLGHSDNPSAVMYPYYHLHTGLGPDDIAAIRQLYAARDSAPDPGAPVPPAVPPSVSPLLLVVQAPPASTTATTISLSGAVSGGAGSISLSWATNQGSSGTAQGSSNWTISAIPLNVGDNLITITARDAQQNSVVQTVAVNRTQPSAPKPAPPTPPPSGPDTTAPSLTIASPASTNVSTSASSIIVSGTASDNVGVTKVTWSSSTGGSGTASGATSWSTAPIQLYIGITTIVIHASDAAGNTSWRSLVVTRR